MTILADGVQDWRYKVDFGRLEGLRRWYLNFQLEAAAPVRASGRTEQFAIPRERVVSFGHQILDQGVGVLILLKRFEFWL